MMGLEHFPSEEIERCLGGLRADAAIRNILERKAEREAGRPSRLSRKTACILQGGAMRGVFSAGSIIALEMLGFTEGFDAVYGTSAGAINGAYFLAHQSAFGTSIYYQDIANRKFIDPLRLKKVVDMDFLFDDIIARKKRLAVERTRQNRTPLYIVATDVETACETIFDSHDESVDLLAALKASAAMPILYHHPVTVNGRQYFDGGVVDSIPIERAITDGCTDVLVVFTMPKDYRATPPGLVERWLAARLLRPLSRELEMAFYRRQESYNRAIDMALGKVRVDAQVNIVAVFPDPDLPLKRLTKEPGTLKQAAMECGHRVLRLFSESNDSPAELLQFVRG